MNLDPLNLSVNTGEGRNIANACLSGTYVASTDKRFFVPVLNLIHLGGELLKKHLYPAISVGVLLLIWQVSVQLLQTPTFILPSPIAVSQALLADRQTLFFHSLTTLSEALLGLAIAGIIAFFTALLMDYYELLKTAIYPILVVSQTLPIMVLGPLLTLWFGFGLAPKVILVILMSYFPMVVSFADSLSKASREQIIFLRTMGASTGQIYRIFKIPEGLAGFFSGLKVAATYCVSGAIVGEWLSAQSGLGYYMIRVKNSYQIDKVFAAILCVIVLSLLLNGLSVLMKKSYYYWLYTRG